VTDQSEKLNVHRRPIINHNKIKLDDQPGGRSAGSGESQLTHCKKADATCAQDVIVQADGTPSKILINPALKHCQLPYIVQNTIQSRRSASSPENKSYALSAQRMFQKR